MSVRRWTACLIVLLALTACDGDQSTSPETTSPPTTVDSTPQSTDLPETTTTTVIVDEGDVPPLAIYLAAIDRGLMGTRYEGDVYLEPELFVSTGQLFCSLLGAELSPSEVLASYVGALEQESDEVDDVDFLLGGVVLGASVQVICPEFADLVIDGSVAGS